MTYQFSFKHIVIATFCKYMSARKNAGLYDCQSIVYAICFV